MNVAVIITIVIVVFLSVVIIMVAIVSAVAVVIIVYMTFKLAELCKWEGEVGRVGCYKDKPINF